MKKLFLLIIFIYSSSAGMETKQNYTTLSCIKYPRQAYYLYHNRVITNGTHGCHIINPITDTIITPVHKDYSADLAIHPNKKKFALAQKETITIYTYDNKSDKVEQLWTLKEHPENEIYSSIFNPLKNTIITRRAKFTGFMEHNYQTNKTLYWNNPEINVIAPQIAYNTTKPEICLAHNNGDIDIYEEKMVTLLHNFNVDELHRFCQYGPNGSFIICGGQKTIFILYPNKKQKVSISAKKDNNFDCIALAPNGLILATLSSPENVIRYYNLQTLKCSHKDSLILPNTSNNTVLSFSPDGIDLLITHSEGCMTTSNQKKMLYYLFLINNIKLNTITELPADIIKLFMANLLKIYYY